MKETTRTAAAAPPPEPEPTHSELLVAMCPASCDAGPCAFPRGHRGDCCTTDGYEWSTGTQAMPGSVHIVTTPGGYARLAFPDEATAVEYIPATVAADLRAKLAAETERDHVCADRLIMAAQVGRLTGLLRTTHGPPQPASAVVDLAAVIVPPDLPGPLGLDSFWNPTFPHGDPPARPHRARSAAILPASNATKHTSKGGSTMRNYRKKEVVKGLSAKGGTRSTAPARTPVTISKKGKEARQVTRNLSPAAARTFQKNSSRKSAKPAPIATGAPARKYRTGVQGTGVQYGRPPGTLADLAELGRQIAEPGPAAAAERLLNTKAVGPDRAVPEVKS